MDRADTLRLHGNRDTAIINGVAALPVPMMSGKRAAEGNRAAPSSSALGPSPTPSDLPHIRTKLL